MKIQHNNNNNDNHVVSDNNDDNNDDDDGNDDNDDKYSQYCCRHTFSCLKFSVLFYFLVHFCFLFCCFNK